MENNQEKSIKPEHIIIQLLLVVVLIAVGYGVYYYFLNNKPQVKKTGKKEVRPVYVDVKKFEKQSADIVVEAMGEIVPSKEINLSSRVLGQIIKVSKNFYPGGLVKKGELIALIDPGDYEVELEKAKASLKKAKAELELEIGQQKSARKELEYYEKSGMEPLDDKSLALRKPQLESARAELESAAAQVKKAELNLSRTKITAPFDAIIVSTAVNIGSNVSAQENICVLYGISKYRVNAFVPSDRLNYLYSKGGKIETKVKSQTSNAVRTGVFKSVTGKIAKDSRMAEVIIEIDDPLGLKNGKPSIIAGDYAAVSIKADNMDNVMVVPREYVHNNEYLWLYKDGFLEIRKVNIFWKDSKNIILKEGLENGEQIITSSISIPFEKMPLIINEKIKRPEKKEKQEK